MIVISKVVRRLTSINRAKIFRNSYLDKTNTSGRMLLVNNSNFSSHKSPIKDINEIKEGERYLKDKNYKLAE